MHTWPLPNLVLLHVNNFACTRHVWRKCVLTDPPGHTGSPGFDIPDSEDIDGLPFRVPPDNRVMGTTFQRHGANLHGVMNKSYVHIVAFHH